MVVGRGRVRGSRLGVGGLHVGGRYEAVPQRNGGLGPSVLFVVKALQKAGPGLLYPFDQRLHQLPCPQRPPAKAVPPFNYR